MSKPDFPLEQLQRWMQACLIRPAEPALREQHGAISGVKPEELIAPSQRMSAGERLAIYQRGYFARLLECMSKQFSVLEHAIGKELFRDFAGQYLQLYPSASYTLGKLGDRFAGFLQSTRPDRDAPPEERESWPDFMIELARLEWSCYKVLEADGRAKGYAVSEKEGGSPQFYLPPAIELFELQFPSYQYYKAVLDRQNPGFPAPHKNYLAIINRNHRIGAFDLQPVQYDLISYLVNRKPAEEALQSIAQQYRIGDQQLKQSWKNWKDQWIKWGMLIPV